MMQTINSLTYLKKVELLHGNGLLLKFDNLPFWKHTNSNMYFNDRHHDFYEGIYIYFTKNILNYNMILQNHIGERLFIEISNEFLNVWDAEYFDHEEERSCIDELEDIEIEDFKFEKIEKTATDWKYEYQRLEKIYLELIAKK